MLVFFLPSSCASSCSMKRLNLPFGELLQWLKCFDALPDVSEEKGEDKRKRRGELSLSRLPGPGRGGAAQVALGSSSAASFQQRFWRTQSDDARASERLMVSVSLFCAEADGEKREKRHTAKTIARSWFSLPRNVSDT